MQPLMPMRSGRLPHIGSSITLRPSANPRTTQRITGGCASEQKRLEPECATCGGSPGGFVLQAHHVEGAYGNLGKERPGADLETLCKLCHMDLSPKSPHFGIIALLGECQREWDEWWHSMSPEEQQRYMDDAQAHGL